MGCKGKDQQLDSGRKCARYGAVWWQRTVSSQRVTLVTSHNGMLKVLARKVLARRKKCMPVCLQTLPACPRQAALALVPPWG